MMNIGPNTMFLRSIIYILGLSTISTPYIPIVSICHYTICLSVILNCNIKYIMPCVTNDIHVIAFYYLTFACHGVLINKNNYLYKKNCFKHHYRVS